MFCEPCNSYVHDWSSFLQSEDKDEGEVVYTPFRKLLHQNIDSLRTSSNASCSICRNIWFSLTDRQQLGIEQETAVYLHAAPDQGKPILKVSFEGKNAAANAAPSMVAMFLRRNESGTLSRLLEECGSMGRSHSGSDANFQLARYWVSQCLEHHSSCSHRTDFLPTRVLDVRADDQDKASIRLVETLGLAHRTFADYAVLSHCWGLRKFLITTVENYHRHQECISVHDLPPSFQDAVETTRKMGLRYLWIDSLCIIQNSANDWAREAVQMSDIYAKALFTITSAHSSNAFGGMFVERDGVRTFSFEVNLRLATRKHRTRRLATRDIHLMFLPTPRREIVWDMADLPIYKRAWCFQEMVLSQRNLIFDPDGMRFECVEIAGSERDPIGGIRRNPLWMRNMQTAINHVKPNEDLFGPLHDDLPSRASIWHFIVENYTSRSLTEYSDKLIAIAGVAAVFSSQAAGNMYMAGLWMHHLHLDLCWFIRHDASMVVSGSNISNLVTHPPPYRDTSDLAPTWSWGSINVPVVYSSNTRAHTMCEIEDVHLTGVINGVETVSKSQGEIKIRGDTRVLYVYALEAHRAEVEQIGLQYRYTDSYGLPASLAPPGKTMLATTDPPSFFGSRQLLPVLWSPDEVITPDAPVVFMAMHSTPEMTGMSIENGRQLIKTLALIPDARQEGCYRRVGFAVWDDCSWFGYDCAQDRKLKAAVWRRLSWSLGRIGPPKLCHSKPHLHAYDDAEIFWPEESYHSSVKMVRQSLTII